VLNAWKLKKLYLLKGKPMRMDDQSEKWQKELHLLEKANPDFVYSVMPV